MTNDEKLKRRKADASVSHEYCPRFGVTAVDKGFITALQLKEGIAEQVEDDLNGRPHRLIGTIFFEKGWMTYAQIEEVLALIFKKPG